MKEKLMVVLAIILFATSTFASVASIPQKQTEFESRRASLLKMLDERMANAETLKSCLEEAKGFSDLKGCKEHRKNIGTTAGEPGKKENRCCKGAQTPD